MRILALDTALGATAAAVIDFPTGDIVAADSQVMERGHAEALVPMVQRLMAEVPGGFASLDRVATTIGPGSFTGLRVAISAARSFGLALKIPVVGVSTLTAYAVPLIAAGSRTAIASAIDARHGAVFFESFWSDGKIANPPALLPLEEAAQRIKLWKTRTVGNAAHLLAKASRAVGCDCESEDAQPAPDIAWIARLGAAADPASAPANPYYLRAVSATPQASQAVARA